MARRPPREPKHPKVSRLLSKILTFMITMIFAPGFFLVQMATVDFGLFNQILMCYLFMNLYGNMILSIKTDTTTRVYGGDGELCPKCGLPRPKDGWHCTRCDVCIVGSNHHCTFLTHCVGRHNYRYYLCFLGHFAALMIYYLCFYGYILAINFDASAFKRALMPMNYALIMELSEPEFNMEKFEISYDPYRLEDIYVVYFLINCGLFALAVALFSHHIRNVFRGTTSYEYAKKLDYARPNWKTSFVNTLGNRWYLAVLWPFVKSPLPGERKMLESLL